MSNQLIFDTFIFLLRRDARRLHRDSRRGAAYTTRVVFYFLMIIMTVIY